MKLQVTYEDGQVQVRAYESCDVPGTDEKVTCNRDVTLDKEEEKVIKKVLEGITKAIGPALKKIAGRDAVQHAIHKLGTPDEKLQAVKTLKGSV